VRLGIRLQWLLAFGALLVLAFAPLFFAVSRLTQASISTTREASARELGRAIAGLVSTASEGRSRAELEEQVSAQIVEGSVTAIAAYGRDGAPLVAAGPESEWLPKALEHPTERVAGARTDRGARLLVVVPGSVSRASVAVLLVTDVSGGASGALVRLMALYTAVVASALLFLGYAAVTRLVVRPVEQLSLGAANVATGGRTLDLPTSGARELVDLGVSLRAMTDRLRADEEALRAKVVELEEKTEALKSAQETLIRSERLASVGRLAAGVAHEIGNPIAAILGFEELLLDGDLPRDEQRDFLLRMKRETERIHRVLRDLLDFARAPGRTGEEEQKLGSAANAIEAAITLVGPQRELRGVRITRDVAADLPPIGMAEERLEQVLLNLLLNAGDAVSHPGGAIAISARLEDGLVVIHVDDDGPGIAPEVFDKLFEPFVTTKEVGKGTGLGLAVCRGLVEAAGGSISAERAPLGGARFALRLPTAKDP
jgi:C4-dicarboxylate-specific signal transduction histidine kinase